MKLNKSQEELDNDNISDGFIWGIVVGFLLGLVIK